MSSAVSPYERPLVIPQHSMLTKNSAATTQRYRTQIHNEKGSVTRTTFENTPLQLH